MKRNKSGLTNSQKEKLKNDARRIVARKYGFKQHSYSNWTVRNDYFFFLHDINGVKLYVKPLYMDDLLWEIVHHDKIKPMSLRANGCLVAAGDMISEFPDPLAWDADDSNFAEKNAEELWEKIFSKCDKEINRFLIKNPNVEDYEVSRDVPDYFQYLMYLCHHNRFEDAVEYIKERREAGLRVSINYLMEDGSSKNAIDFILEHCQERLQ